MQRTSGMKPGRRGSTGSGHHNKEQKRKSSLISMAVPSPNNSRKTTAGFSPTTGQQPPLTVRRTSLGPHHKEDDKPHLVRVVSQEEDNFGTASSSSRNNRRATAPPAAAVVGSFHDDLDRLGHAIRSLSFVQPDTPTPSPGSTSSTATFTAPDPAQLTPNGSNTSPTTTTIPRDTTPPPSQVHVPTKNPFDVLAMQVTPERSGVKTTIQNPFDQHSGTEGRAAPPPPVVVVAPAVHEQHGNGTSQNPFHHHEQHHQPSQVRPASLNPFEGPTSPVVDQHHQQNHHGHQSPVLGSSSQTGISRRTSQNPFDQHLHAAEQQQQQQQQQEATATNPFVEASLQIPNGDIDTTFDVPIDGQKVIMTPQQQPRVQVDHDLLPLDGDGSRKVLLSPLNQSYHPHHEISHPAPAALSPHSASLHVPLDGERVIMAHPRSFDDYHSQGNETSDDESDEDDDDDDDDDVNEEVHATFHQQQEMLGQASQTATAAFSFC